MGHRLLGILVDLAHGCILNCLSLTILNLTSFKATCVDCGAWLDLLSRLSLYSVLEAVVSPLDDGNGARARVAENCVHKLPAIRQAN